MGQYQLESSLQKKLYQSIYKRKSVRKYKKENLSPESLKEIENFFKKVVVLNPQIKTRAKIVSSDQVKSLFPLRAPHYLQFFSENKNDWLLNAGFILQQFDLYLSASSLGSCWFGLAKTKIEVEADSEMEYVITLAFGIPVEPSQRESIENFERKSLAAIKKGEEHYDLLEAARLAPSATNGQPWYFVTKKDRIHLYQSDFNFIKKFFYQKMNRIDMGIVLAHLWLAALEKEKGFEFVQMNKKPVEIENYNYLGTVILKK
ncbi:MAG: nitroreductase family protein [Bacillota bacterium]